MQAKSPAAIHLKPRPVIEQRAGVSLNGTFGEHQKCHMCDKTIFDQEWFCRLPRGDERILLCCPSCAIRYFDQSNGTMNGFSKDHSKEQRLEGGTQARPVACPENKMEGSRA
jgi:hypothetical protein